MLRGLRTRTKIARTSPLDGYFTSLVFFVDIASVAVCVECTFREELQVQGLIATIAIEECLPQHLLYTIKV